MATRRWLWTAVVFALLVAVASAVYWRYGPVCVVGEERCDGSRVLVCVQNRTGRDPGRGWVEARACGSDASCSEHEARAFCTSPASGGCEAPARYCEGRDAVTCELDDMLLLELRRRCPDGTRCASGECVAE